MPEILRHTNLTPIDGGGVKVVTTETAETLLASNKDALDGANRNLRRANLKLYRDAAAVGITGGSSFLLSYNEIVNRFVGDRDVNLQNLIIAAGLGAVSLMVGKSAIENGPQIRRLELDRRDIKFEADRQDSDSQR